MGSDYELLMIGGGPCAFAAARGYRAAAGTGRVAIVADEARMPYRRPALTKELLRGEVAETTLALAAESWLSENGVSLVSGRGVLLDHDARVLTLSGGRELSYATCVLATGAEPMRLPIPGADDPSVRVVRTLAQVRELKERLERGAPVIVIGSGFIGCEITASLRRRGHPVALVSDEDAPNRARLGDQAAGELAGWLREEGATLELGCAVDAIERHGDTLTLSFGDGRVSASVVVMATGVTPRSELLVPSGTPLRDGAVPVDDRMCSALSGVLAAGDVCVAENATAGRPLRVEHWGDALMQGQIAGRTAAGERDHWRDVPGFWSTIGARTLKYAAWGDGFATVSFERHAHGGFTVWYERDGRVVGVLTHDADEDYERGRERIAAGAPAR